jgi:hypothetical protein
VFEISGVTVLVGMHRKDFTDVQMTRRISKVIIHSGYNAATYVSFVKPNDDIFDNSFNSIDFFDLDQ